MYGMAKSMQINYERCTNMKEGIHPEYKEVTIKCACGETVVTKSTKGDMRVEICSKCHPFYTGKQKLVDAGGRVDKFKKRLEMAK
ncbi:MAG: 50S ribosomal protein L31 [Ruminococcaceae bacterium]|nr:50S ribosomal protein L31 [Oscillospiraceae bacterium]